MNVSPAVIRTLNESIRPYLSEGRASWHFWLLTATFFVGIGVILEAPDTFREARKEFLEYWSHRRRRLLVLNKFGLPVVKPDIKPRPWVATISVSGWLMVAAGVVGEFWFDDKVSGFDATLQWIDNELLAQANTGAGAANVRADEAIESAAVISRDNIKLKGALDKSVTDARTEAAKLEQANIDVGLKLAAQVKANLELEATLAPRVLAIRGTDDPSLKVLTRFAGTTVKLGMINDAEALHAAASIKWFLERAGFKVTSTVPVDLDSPLLNGISDGVTVMPSDNNTLLFNAQLWAALLQAFSANGWREITPRFDRPAIAINPEGFQLLIFVGFKPLPYDLLNPK
jgi:hypothetical protein